MKNCHDCAHADRLSDTEVYCDIFGRTSCFPEYQIPGDGLARYHASETCIYYKEFDPFDEKEDEK